MGETRVDLLHLLEDLADAYPGSLEETILTEVVANSLDSGAARVDCSTDPAAGRLTIVDDGAGMQRREFRRFHDIAASAKRRGEGIGFAGVGIKLGLLVCEEVLTETRRGKAAVATAWHLASRQRAPWKWVPPPGLVNGQGTAVRLTLRQGLSPLVDPGFLEETLRQHFAPLLDPRFAGLLGAHYPAGVAFALNGRPLEPEELAPSAVPIEIRMPRKRKPSAIGYLLRAAGPLPEAQRGVAVSTFGKVIKRGWDWLGLSPAGGDRIGGLIEAPDLAASLTLNKGDFIRTGARGAVYLAYRKVLQEAVSRQLAEWGDLPDTGAEPPPKVASLRRDLERVLENLAGDFPLLGSLVERRPGGQKRLPWDGSARPGAGEPVAARALASEGALETLPEPVQRPEAESPRTGVNVHLGGAALPARSARRRRQRYGLQLAFEERPDDPELARLVESTVWINQMHPAYRRSTLSRSLGYHLAIAVALALAPLAVEPQAEDGFVTAFLAQWGAALRGSRAGHRRRLARH